MAGKDMVRYQTTDLDEMRAEREELDRAMEEQKAGADYLQLKEGKNIIRVLPPRMGSGPKRNPFLRLWIHYIRNPYDPTAVGRPVICPLKMKRSGTCLVCAQVGKWRRSGAAEDQKNARSFKSSIRVFSNAVDMNDMDKGVRIFQCGTQIYAPLLGYLAPEPPEEPVDFTHPESGFNILIEREKIGTESYQVKHTTRLSTRPSPLPNMRWLEQLHDLTKVIQPMDDERIRAIIEGRGEEEQAAPAADPDVGSVNDDAIDTDFDEPAPPPARPATPPRRPTR